MIDLSPYYNAGTTNSTVDASNNSPNNLAEFPIGITRFAGVAFVTAGIIQLAGKNAESRSNRFPEKVEQIKIGHTCQEIHILHGAGFWAPDGAAIAVLLLHYENGEERKIPIVYGRHVRDWWQSKKDPPPSAGTEIAWFGHNRFTVKEKKQLRIYRSTFQNPLPTVEIESIDYVSTLTTCAPFLLAMTLE